jgi:putative oxidoreductase
MDVWTARALSLLRIVTSLLFLQHGLMKLFDFPGPQPGVPDPLPALLLVAGALEVLAGAVLVIGLLVRPAALLCSGEMAFAYFLYHAPKGFWPALNGGDAAVFYCFAFLFLAVAGGGSWSLDALIARRRPSPS